MKMMFTKNQTLKVQTSKLLFAVALLFMVLPLMAQPSGGPYGPVSKTYEIPQDANNIFYVAPNGNAQNDGLSVENPTTLEAAIAKVVTDDAIILRGGTYRTGNLVLNQGVTIQPYKDEQPVIKGTYVAKDWKKLRTDLWITKWENFFPSAPQDWWVRTRQGMWTPLYKFNDDMVFVDGKILEVTGWEGDVDEDSYYIDYENELVYIGVDPEDKEVEITAFNVCINRVTNEVHGKQSDKKGYTLRGVTLTQYAYRALEIQGKDPNGVSPESEHGKDVVGTTIENCEISYCSRVAGYLRGDNLTLKNNKVSHTSTEGIFILASNDVLLEKNIFTKNNIEQITGYFPAAVKIFNQCYRVTCNDNLIIDQPYSNGIWYDVGNVDGVFTNNWVENVGSNKGKISTERIHIGNNGFFFEISKGCTVAGNVFVNCNNGLMSLNSSGVKVYNNTFVNSTASFARTERSAEGDHFGWHPATGPGVEERYDHVFVNNLLTADENFERPMLYVWQPSIICDRATGSSLKDLDNNVYVNEKAKYDVPLMVWAPVENEKCSTTYLSLEGVRGQVDGFEENSTYLKNYTGSIYKSVELGNYQLLPNFDVAAEQADIPSEINKMINRKNEEGVGAYPLKH
jgi:parallel beta-helix repeat protein